MKRAYSVTDVIRSKYDECDLGSEWEAAIGKPELCGTWFIYGAPKNGKTTFAMQMAKMLANHRRVAYDSVEEGISRTIQMAMERVSMADVAGRVMLLDKETVPELMERLSRRTSPDVIFIDSVQFLELKFSEYKILKAKFPTKLFIYISHVEGNLPAGQTARKIWRDANATFYVSGFKAFPVSRYGGGRELVISEEKAKEYYLS